MSYRFELHPDRPVLLNALGPRFTVEEFPDMAAEAITRLDQVDQPVYYIIDLDGSQFVLNDVMQGAYVATRGANPPLHHPKIIETIAITDNWLIEMSSRSMDSHVFGFLKVKVFPRLDEALAYVDGQTGSVFRRAERSANRKQG